jgi:hypothetical protein
MPITVPKIPTVRATFASFSFLFFAITARIIAAGPRKIGRSKKLIAPRTIAITEKVFPLLGVDSMLDIEPPGRL